MGQLPFKAPPIVLWKDRGLEDGAESSGILSFRHHIRDVNCSSQQPCLDMRTQDKAIRQPMRGPYSGNHIFSVSQQS